MRIRPRHRPFVRTALGGVGLCIVAATQSQARLLPSDAAGPLTREAQNASPHVIPAWWTGFREPALIAMQQAAARQALAGSAGEFIRPDDASRPSAWAPLDAQVAAAFVATRVLNVRLSLADQLVSDLSELRRLAAAGSPTPARADVVADFEARLAAAQRHAQTLQMHRDQLIGRLAAWCGVAPEAFPEEFRAALEARTLPAFYAAAPPRLARAVLVGRADVSIALGRRAAERHRAPPDDQALADAVQRLAGWIDATDAGIQPGADPAPSGAADEELERIVGRAEQEVRDSLAQLWSRHRETAQLAEGLLARQSALIAAERRVELHRGSAADVLLARQHLLFECDQLAVASGDLALAWMRLESSTGGQALTAVAQ